MDRSTAPAPLALFPGCDPWGILFGSLDVVDRGLIEPRPVLIAWLVSLAPGIDPPAAALAALSVAAQRPGEARGEGLLALLDEVARCAAADPAGGTARVAERVRRSRGSGRGHHSHRRANLVLNEG